MSRAFRQIGLVLMFAMAGSSALAFSLLGPTEAYQVESLGYLSGFRNGTKNLDDEYRWNTRVVYYSYDPEFTSYFGSNGIAAVDGAFGIINNLTNVSLYSPSLSEFPTQSKDVNYTASALQLYDLKSSALEILVERLGLASPDEYTWTLRARALPPGAQCPNYEYLVIKRNFDPITLEPSSYINGNLLTYQILELCPTPSRAFAVEVLVDPLDQQFTSVASFGAFLGDYYRGLTRDDVGGLRYLLSTNNLNWETTPADAFVPTTNTSQAILLYPSNLQVFAEQAVSNNAAALQALWPGLQVTGTSNYFVNVVETNVTATYESSPYGSAGAPPVLVFTTNFTTNVATRYVHTFGNVLTNQVYTNCPWALLTTNIAPSPYAPPGSGISVTNVTFQHFVKTNCVSGSFFILPTNVCDYHVLYTQLTQVLTFTNFLTNTFATNTITLTNVASTNAADYYEFSQSIVTYFTNTILVGYPVTCPDDITSLFQGIEKVTFVRRDYDSLLGQFFQPVTNQYTLTEVTNNKRVTRFIERSIAVPDILISADDLVTGPTEYPIINAIHSVNTPNWQTPTNTNPLGPGTIRPNVSFTFNKVGPAFRNFGPNFIDEATAQLDFIWGSFDGSTNTPIVYPVGTDIKSLENMAVLQITQPNVVTNGAYQLPEAELGVPYSFELEAVGGQPPYTWSVAPGSAALPTGITISAAGVVSGTASVPGIYDFNVRLSETGARFVTQPFTLTVSP